jgi:hypothetical protein
MALPFLSSTTTGTMIRLTLGLNVGATSCAEISGAAGAYERAGIAHNKINADREFERNMLRRIVISCFL